MKPLLIFLVLWLSCTAGSRAAKQLEVCPECDHSTVQSGIAAAQPGDTVWVKPGIYREFNLLIDKPLYLKGSKGAMHPPLCSFVLKSTTVRAVLRLFKTLAFFFTV